MSTFIALILSDKPSDSKLVLFCLVKVDNLTIRMSLKRSERRQEINGFEQTGLALCIIAHQHDNLSRDINIQAGEIPEVSEREMFEIHMCSVRSEEHTSELQSRLHLVCRL